MSIMLKLFIVVVDHRSPIRAELVLERAFVAEHPLPWVGRLGENVGEYVCADRAPSAAAPELRITANRRITDEEEVRDLRLTVDHHRAPKRVHHAEAVNRADRLGTFGGYPRRDRRQTLAERLEAIRVFGERDEPIVARVDLQRDREGAVVGG